MGALFDSEEEVNPEIMDVFPNVGKRERRIGPAASDTEIQVVNELVDENQWINLDLCGLHISAKLEVTGRT